jgi:hypothetical protein
MVVDLRSEIPLRFLTGGLMAYVKLFGSILDSSIMDAPVATRWTWVALMAMADQDGKVEASMGGVAHRARVTREECELAFAYFTSPDPESKTPDNEGRRIEKVDGGWRLLNYEYYRDLQDQEDRRAKAAARQQRRRNRLKLKETVTLSVTQSHANHAISSDSAAAAAADQGDPEAPSPTPPAPAALTPPAEPWPGRPPPRPPGLRWSGADWLKYFGHAWSEAKGRLAYGFGTGTDARASGTLDDVLASMPITEVKRVQELAPKMFAAFLARTGKVEVAGHKFSWFG